MKVKILVMTHDELVKKLGFSEDSIITEVYKETLTQEIKFVVHSKEFEYIPDNHMLICERFK